MMRASLLLALLLAPAAQEDKETVQIPMRDGKTLAADIYKPGKEGKFPTVLIMTPYNKRSLGAALRDPKSKHALLDRETYAYVVVDWRGFYASRKAAVAGRRGGNGPDGYDCVEWIAEQEWSNGKVGMWGPSALGKVQFETAREQPPHLTCIIPVVAGVGQCYGQYFQGGVLRKHYTNILKGAGFGNLQGRLSKLNKYNALWKAVERSTRDVKKIEVPVLMIGGWYDLYTDGVLFTYQSLRDAGNDAKIIIGPWAHMDTTASKVGELEFKGADQVTEKAILSFLERWLLDKKDNGEEKNARIRYYEMGASKWRNADSWPPETLTRTLYLHSRGRLLSKKTDEEASSSEFEHDPEDPSPAVGGCAVGDNIVLRDGIGEGPRDQRKKVESREDCVAFTTEELEADVAVTGVIRAKLQVSSDNDEFDVAIRVTDVHPDGRSMLITDGINRTTSGEVEIAVSVTSHTFVKGHRIRVIVSSAIHPRFERNPNPAKITLHHDGRRNSSVEFPVR